MEPLQFSNRGNMNKRVTAFLSSAVSAPEVCWTQWPWTRQKGKLNTLEVKLETMHLWFNPLLRICQQIGVHPCRTRLCCQGLLETTGPTFWRTRALREEDLGPRNHVLKGDSITSRGKLFMVNSSNRKEHFFYSHTALPSFPQPPAPSPWYLAKTTHPPFFVRLWLDPSFFRLKTSHFFSCFQMSVGLRLAIWVIALVHLQALVILRPIQTEHRRPRFPLIVT